MDELFGNLELPVTNTMPTEEPFSFFDSSVHDGIAQAAIDAGTNAHHVQPATQDDIFSFGASSAPFDFDTIVQNLAIPDPVGFAPLSGANKPPPPPSQQTTGGNDRSVEGELESGYGSNSENGTPPPDDDLQFWDFPDFAETFESKEAGGQHQELGDIFQSIVNNPTEEEAPETLGPVEAVAPATSHVQTLESANLAGQGQMFYTAQPSCSSYGRSVGPALGAPSDQGPAHCPAPPVNPDQGLGLGGAMPAPSSQTWTVSLGNMPAFDLNLPDLPGLEDILGPAVQDCTGLSTEILDPDQPPVALTLEAAPAPVPFTVKPLATNVTHELNSVVKNDQEPATELPVLDQFPAMKQQAVPAPVHFSQTSLSPGVKRHQPPVTLIQEAAPAPVSFAIKSLAPDFHYEWSNIPTPTGSGSSLAPTTQKATVNLHSEKGVPIVVLPPTASQRVVAALKRMPSPQSMPTVKAAPVRIPVSSANQTNRIVLAAVQKRQSAIMDAVAGPSGMAAPPLKKIKIENLQPASRRQPKKKPVGMSLLKSNQYLNPSANAARQNPSTNIQVPQPATMPQLPDTARVPHRAPVAVQQDPRALHNQNERMRRQELKLNYDALRAKLPDIATAEKASKRQILTSANAYTQHLNRVEAEKSSAKAMLRKENDKLMAHLHRLKMRR